MRIVIALVFGAVILQSAPSYAAEGTKTPHQIINALQQRLYVIGETTGKLSDFAQAEAKATEEISGYSHDKDTAALIEKDKNGMTPLMKASYLGYADVVATLLKYPGVVGAIDEIDPKGMSAWMHASFAIRQSLPACNPTVKQNPFAWVSVIVTQPYYNSKQPYPPIREALVNAGAAADMEKAKELWLSTCTQQSDQTRAQVSRTTDLMKTVIQEGAAAMSEASQTR